MSQAPLTPTSRPIAPTAPTTLSLRELTADFLRTEAKIRLGGGAAAIERQHEKGRLTARERIARLVDPAENTRVGDAGYPSTLTELALWSAYGMYAEHGGAPAAGVVTGVGKVQGRDCMIIANDATVKAGAFFPMTCKKIIRAQTIAMMARLPLIYLVDSAGVFLPLQEDVFPDTDDFGRIFRNNAVISAEGIPQIAAIMGYCVAGGGYLPVLCDTLLMTEGSGLYLAGPALVKAAIGQVVSDEELGGAKMHAGISGTIDFREKDDESCLRRLRELVGKYVPQQIQLGLQHLQRLVGHLEGRRAAKFSSPTRELELKKLFDQDRTATSPEERERLTKEIAKHLHLLGAEHRAARDELEEDLLRPEKLRELYESLGAGLSLERAPARQPRPFRDPQSIYDSFTDKPGAQYEVRDIVSAVVDSRGEPDEEPIRTRRLEPSRAQAQMLASNFDEYKADYGPSIVCGYAKIGGMACGIVADQKKLTKTGAGVVQLPGVIYHDSADKAARFIMDCNQRKIPLIFFHDTTGFMVGKDSEQHGIIRAGAKMVNAMSNSIVPKIVVILGGSYGAGNYAMCGRAFDPFLSYAWPSAKCAVMGAAQATGVLAMIEEKSRERKGEKIDEETHKAILDAVRASYNEQQDIRHGAARGWVDRIIEPHRTREELIAALGMTSGWDYTRAFRTGVLQT